MNTQQKTAKKSKNKLLTDILILIISAIIAMFLWVYVMDVDAPTSEKTFTGVRVTVNNIEGLFQASGLSIVSESDDILIDVTLQGTKSELSKLKSSDIKAYVDASTVSEAGTHPLEIKYMPFPGKTTFSDASSTTVSMTFDTTGTLEVPIVVKFENCIIPTGYSTGECILNHETVTVRGANTDLSKIKEAVVFVKAGTLKSTITVMDAEPILYDKNGRVFTSEYVSYNIEPVDVIVPVDLTKRIDLTAVGKHGYLNSNNSVVTVFPSYITVKGDASEVEQLPSTLNIAQIDEKSAADSLNVSLENILSSKITILDGVTSVQVKVNYLNSHETILAFNTSDIIVNNPHNFEYAFVNEKIDINLRVAVDKLSMLTAENISVRLDLSSIGELSESSISLPVHIEFKNSLSGGEAYEIGEYKADVSLSRASGN